MMNPGWEFWRTATSELLQPNGHIAIVDFHRSPFLWFAKHMSKHHVKMEAHLLPEFQHSFKTFQLDIRKAYFGLWQYFIFVGKQKTQHS
jgi:S-adenosylmethionine-diacylgycerolhomoserine-N-methlytransferase